MPARACRCNPGPPHQCRHSSSGQSSRLLSGSVGDHGPLSAPCPVLIVGCWCSSSMVALLLLGVGGVCKRRPAPPPATARGTPEPAGRRGQRTSIAAQPSRRSSSGQSTQLLIGSVQDRGLPPGPLQRGAARQEACGRYRPRLRAWRAAARRRHLRPAADPVAVAYQQRTALPRPGSGGGMKPATPVWEAWARVSPAVCKTAASAVRVQILSLPTSDPL